MAGSHKVAEGVGIGDLHFDKMEKILPGVSNQLIGMEIRKPLKYALRNGIEHVFFYGDICEKARMSYDAHLTFIRILLDPRYTDLTMWIILGNHDFDEKGRHSLEILEEMARYAKRKIHFITSPIDTGIDGVPVRFLPFPAETTSKKMLNVGHFEVAGSIRDNGKRIKDGYDKEHLILMGHLHTCHKVRKTYYSGTLYQTNFGESMPKSFHHFKVADDMRHKILDIPNDPSFKLFNLKVESRKTLREIESNKLYLYKLFVQEGVRVNPEDLAKYPNVVRINRFKDDKDLKAQLDEEWSSSAEIEQVFKPEEDVKLFLSTKKNVEDELRKRVLRINRKAISSFMNTGTSDGN